MSEPTQRMVESNGIRLNIAEQGKGPLVVLCHGFPESWYSWRHQLEGLAAAGFHAVAPDMRGYGKSDRPEAIDQYTILHMVGDLVGLLDALDSPTAVIVGHDWGATVAWHAALLRPDRFRAVVGLSIPFRPRAKEPPTRLMPRTADAQFYQLYFQEPGVAEKELELDPNATVRNMLYGASGDAPRGGGPSGGIGMVPKGGGFLRGPEAPPSLPQWLSDRDIDFYAGEFRRTGFPRPPQLVSQHRPQLGAAGSLRRRAGDGPGSLCRGGPRHGGGFSRHGPAARQSQEVRAGIARLADAPWMRPLDPAGAAEGGQCRDH
jgi:pimeloyl-ACP methyl ester carboxylesterase